MNFKSLFVITATFFSINALAAIPAPSKKHYQVNMRIGIKGAAPISVNTSIKLGKKSFVTELTDDGQTETQVEVSARKSKTDNKSGLMMDLKITKKVKGETKFSERTQMFAPENEEREMKVGATDPATKSRSPKALSLAVVVHQL